MFGRTCGVVAALACGSTLGACYSTSEPSDLRPDGPPEVLSVLVNAPDQRTDPNYTGLPLEIATFCKLNDDKRPEIVGTLDFSTIQVCPADMSVGATEVTTAFPSSWYVRIMFDQLLDPNIEELIPVLDANGNPTGNVQGSLAATQPVTLQCGGIDVPYDGYYSPSGNALTYPVGPSLYIAPVDTSVVASGSMCTISTKDVVVDKAGLEVPDGTTAGYADERGPYMFQIDTLQFVSSDPSPVDLTVTGATLNVIDPGSPVVLTFNDTIDANSVPASEIVLTEADAMCNPVGAGRTAVVVQDPDDPDSIDISDANTADPTTLEFVPKKTYVLTFATGATASDLAGGTAPLPTPADFTLCFQTDVAD